MFSTLADYATAVKTAMFDAKDVTAYILIEGESFDIKALRDNDFIAETEGGVTVTIEYKDVTTYVSKLIDKDFNCIAWGFEITEDELDMLKYG